VIQSLRLRRFAQLHSVEESFVAEEILPLSLQIAQNLEASAHQACICASVLYAANSAHPLDHIDQLLDPSSAQVMTV
jgi:hypothetical protein